MSKQQQVQTHHDSGVQSTFRQLKECSCRNLRMVTGVLVIAVAVGEMQAAITTYDFNDGTVQGWGAGSQANENNQLRFTNENKSVFVQLMQFNPAPANWSGAREITFDLEFTSYAGISAPSELTNHEFEIARSGEIMGGDYGSLKLNLDVAGWDFNEKRSFTVNIADANFSPYGDDPSRDGVLQDVYAMSFGFSRPINTGHANASGLFDNFSVVPEPSTLLLGMLGLAGFALVRRRLRSIS